MNKALSVVTCCLAALCLFSRPSAAQSSRPFQDVPTAHFAYAACADLQHQGLISGYPDSYFQGMRTLSRYEFAVAIKRALDTQPTDAAHSTLPQWTELKRLVDEFQTDLTLLGATPKEIAAGLERQRAAIQRGAAPAGVARANRPPDLLPIAGADRSGIGPLSPFSTSPSATRDLLSGLRATFPPGGALFASNLSTRLGQAGIGPDAGASLQVDLPISRAGLLGLSLRDLTGLIASNLQTRDVRVYGAGLTVRPLPRFTIGAGLSRSVSQQAVSISNGWADGDNAVYRLHIGYRSGPADAVLGYQYIDPSQETAGAASLSPVQGPFTRLAWRFSPSLQSYLGGDLYTTEHLDLTGSSLLPMNIYRGMAGIRWSPTRGLSLSADYEGILYDLNNAVSPSARRPLEQYITLGAGLNISRNAILKMAYQIINQPDATGADASASHGASTSVFTTQFAIHF